MPGPRPRGRPPPGCAPRKSSCSGSSSTASAGRSASGSASDADIDAKHTMAVPSVASAAGVDQERRADEVDGQDVTPGGHRGRDARGVRHRAQRAQARRPARPGAPRLAIRHVEHDRLDHEPRVPAGQLRAAAAARPASSRSATTRVSTRPAMRAAQAAPIPRAAPVTMPTDICPPIRPTRDWPGHRRMTVVSGPTRRTRRDAWQTISVRPACASSARARWPGASSTGPRRANALDAGHVLRDQAGGAPRQPGPRPGRSRHHRHR